MTKKDKAMYLLKHYGYLMILGFCAITIVIAMIITISKNQNNQSAPVGGGSESIAVNGGVVNTSMYLPVLNATVSKSYSNTSLQYNETLKQYEAHMGIDFVASAGSKVYSVLDGQVLEVGNNYLQGNYVIISHDNGLKSVYSSLDENITVSKGDYVSKGDIIGCVGSSAYSELQEGNHLHFELLDNDKKIDPAGYLSIENK